MTASETMIRVQGLTRRFNDVTAVDEIDFNVPRAAICGFIGPNGAGKTTTMRILATLDLPDAGGAWIDGHSVTDDPHAVRHLLGYMPDFGGNYPSITADEYLQFFARAYALNKADRKRRIEATVAFTDLESLLSRPVDGLSKGQKQRLSLARALLPDPQVLVLDEPAEGLDPRARLELRELLKLLARQGKTILISSHILTELDDLIDNALIIDHGRLRFAGHRDQLLLQTQGVASWTMQLRSDPQSALRFVLTRPGVSQAQVMDDALLLQFDENQLPADQLLTECIGEGIRVRQLTEAHHDLEGLFLDLTGQQT